MPKHYSYDAAGNVTQKQLPNSVTTSYSYNPNGWLTNISNSGSQYSSSFTYNYDKAGNRTSQVEGDGATTTFSYDALNRLTEVTYPKDKIEAVRNQYFTPPQSTTDSGNGNGNSSQHGNQGNNGNHGQGNNGNGHSPKADILVEENSGTSSTDQLSQSGSNSYFRFAPFYDFLSNKQGNGGQGNGNGNGNGNSSGSNGNGNGNTSSNGNSGNGNNGNHYGQGNNGGSSNTAGQDPNAVDSASMYPDYLMDPVADVKYAYDAAGNRVSMTADGATTTYGYDSANEMTQDGTSTYQYDNNGNLVEEDTGNGKVQYTYTGDNLLKSVQYPDGTGVTYTYDGQRRKSTRTETYYATTGDNNAPGNSGNAPGHNGTQGNNGNHGQGNNGNGHSASAITLSADPLVTADPTSSTDPAGGTGKLSSEVTNYLYDGANLLKEYGAQGDPLAEYYNVNGETIARQMYGLHDHKQYGYEGNIRTRGGLMYYEYDGLGNVMDITDRTGAQVMGYRYDAFGNLFTQMAAPYNAVGFTGKQYDPKASLMDYGARWYSPNTGRFTTQDSYEGDPSQPLTLNRYSYVDNNPVNFTDPTGHTYFSLNASTTSTSVGSSVTFTASTDYAVASNRAIYIHDLSGDGTLGGSNLVEGPLGSSSMSTSATDYLAQTVSYWAALMLPDGSYVNSNTVTVQWTSGATGGTGGSTGDGSSGVSSNPPTLDQLIQQAGQAFNNAAGTGLGSTVVGLAQHFNSMALSQYIKILGQGTNNPTNSIKGPRPPKLSFATPPDDKIADLQSGGGGGTAGDAGSGGPSASDYKIPQDGEGSSSTDESGSKSENKSKNKNNRNKNNHGKNNSGKNKGTVKTYQTYTKTNQKTGQTYTGRTSGNGTPAENVARRDANHHMTQKGYGPAKLDKSSPNYNAIRGREQQLIDYFGGAQSQGGTSGNRINGISSNNPNILDYLLALMEEFG